MDGWMDGRMSGRVGGWVDGQVDGGWGGWAVWGFSLHDIFIFIYLLDFPIMIYFFSYASLTIYFFGSPNKNVFIQYMSHIQYVFHRYCIDSENMCLLNLFSVDLQPLN